MVWSIYASGRTCDVFQLNLDTFHNLSTSTAYPVSYATSVAHGRNLAHRIWKFAGTRQKATRLGYVPSSNASQIFWSKLRQPRNALGQMVWLIPWRNNKIPRAAKKKSPKKSWLLNRVWLQVVINILCFFDLQGVLSVWIACCTDFTNTSITASGRTKFAAIKDYLQMQLIPCRFGKDRF